MRRNGGRGDKIDCFRVIDKRPVMRIRVGCVAVLGVLFLGTGARASTPSAEERRLLIFEAPGNVLTKAVRGRLHAAIAEVAVGRGLTLASPQALPARLRGCKLPGCLSPVAAATGAIYVLRVDAKFAKESFSLTIELWNSDIAKLLGRDRRDCPICDEQDLWGSAALMTQELLDRALQQAAGASPVAAIQPKSQGSERGMVSLPPASSTSATTSPSAALPQIESGRASSVAEYAGIGLALGGLAVIGMGAYYISVDGDSVGEKTDRVRDTRKYGLPMTIAGGVVLAAGAGLLAWSYWYGTTRVSLGPSGINVAGRF